LVIQIVGDQHGHSHVARSQMKKNTGGRARRLTKHRWTIKYTYPCGTNPAGLPFVAAALVPWPLKRRQTYLPLSER
jgi:hypothetical protein